MNLFTILVFPAVIFLFVVENPSRNNESKLENVRKRLKQEISVLDSEIDMVTKDPLLLDNLCGMINTEGVCYFNSVIQSLFSSRKFLLFYLMNDFDNDQFLSKLIQLMALEMVTNKNIDPVPFLNKLSTHSRLINHCSVDGGNPNILLDELLIGLHIELEGKTNLLYSEGAPRNFFFAERFITMCKICNEYTLDVINSPTISFPFSNSIDESVDFYNNIKEIENKNKYYKCVPCNSFNPIVPEELEYTAIYPRNLIIVLERVKIKNNNIFCIFQEINLNRNILIDGNEYTLYAAICSHLLKSGYHANAIVKRNGRWIVFNDNQLEAFPLNYEDRGILNNYGWILFYRNVNEE